MNLLRYCELKILEVVSVVLVVAVLFYSDSKEEEFTGFNIEPRFQRNNHKLGSNHTKDGKNYNGELLTSYCCVIYFYLNFLCSFHHTLIVKPLYSCLLAKTK